MRLAVMEWYTANILLVMRSPEDAGNASDKQLLTKYMKVQVGLTRLACPRTKPVLGFLS